MGIDFFVILLLNQDTRLPFFLTNYHTELIKIRDAIKSLTSSYIKLLSFARDNWPPKKTSSKSDVYLRYFDVWKELQSPIGVDDREWIGWGSRLAPPQVKLSRFMDENVLTKLIRQVSEKSLQEMK